MAALSKNGTALWDEWMVERGDADGRTTSGLSISVRCIPLILLDSLKFFDLWLDPQEQS
jgi:hypothetical protein